MPQYLLQYLLLQAHDNVMGGKHNKIQSQRNIVVEVLHIILYTYKK